ncbi:MAG: hypothetical protein V4699_02500 [Patescibacteria group bacterium]
MQEDWFKRKFINPRTNEGEPQTEKLKYAREFFEALGNKDPRFSGSVIVGSTMKGYGKENSDIDAILFYYEDPERLEVYSETYTFYADFFNFERDFKLKRKGKIFDISTEVGCHNLKYNFTINPSGKIVLSPKDILHLDDILDAFSYPIIGTKNPKALVPMEKILNVIRTTIDKLSYIKRKKLLEDVLSSATFYIESEFEKYSKRKDLAFAETKKQYLAARLQMLKQTLKNKLGLYD